MQNITSIGLQAAKVRTVEETNALIDKNADGVMVKQIK